MQIHEMDHIKIHWTPGHTGIPDNELADEEAKKAAAGDSSLPHQLPKQLRLKKCQGHILPHSKFAAKQELYSNIKEFQKDIFNQSKRAGYALKINSILPSSAFLKLTKDFQKRYTAILFQLHTGHALLNHHLHQTTKAPSPTCNYCSHHKETVTHLLLECMHFSAQHTWLHHKLTYKMKIHTHNLAILLSHPKCVCATLKYVHS